MNDFKKNFIQIREDLSLTDGERSVMRAELERFAMPPAGVVLSPYTFFTAPMRFASAFVLLVLIGAGGSSALAGGALPGDTLYSVKIHVNESVERSLAPTALAKASVDIKHAEERLTEVELLAASGKADDELAKGAALIVEEKVAAASLTAEALSDAGDEAGADAIHTRINSALLAHADILDAQAEDLEEESGQTLRALSVAVTFAADEAADAREEESVEEETADVEAAQLAESRETGAKERIALLAEELAEEDVPAETKELLAQELASLEADYGANRERMVAEDYEEAAQEYREIERRAYRSFAALASARRITETTGKEVIIAVNAEDVRPEEEAAPAPMMMKAAATLMMEATTTEAVADTQNARRPERALQFWVHDRTEGE